MYKRQPLPCATAEAYAHAVHTGEEPGPAAREEWKSGYTYPKEDEEPEHVLAFGEVLSLEALLALPAREDERGDGWLETEPSRFARLAHRLWSPMLAREEIRTA